MMGNDTKMMIRVTEALRDSVNQCAERIQRPAAQVARELLQDFVERSEERARRVRAIETARGSTFLEGFVADADTDALLKRYADGDLTIDQVIAEAKQAAAKG